MSFLLALALLVSPTALSPVRFAPRAGWTAGTGAVHACPGVSATRCRQVSSWTSTVARRDCAECLPHRTLAALPPRGIAIQTIVALERPFRARPQRWPPRIHRADVGGLEGVPAGVGVYQRLARTGRYEVYVYVFFGRAHPTTAQVETANAVLANARLPD